MISRRTFLLSSATAATAFCQSPPETPQYVPAKAVTSGPKHHWFGYYDKCPWNASGTKLLAMEAEFCDRQPQAGESITVGYVDLKNQNKFVPLDTTSAWSWQQGPMLQWLGQSDTKIIYNTMQGDRCRAVVRDVISGEVQNLKHPIYAISKDGRLAVTLDFARLHRLRPGYGYASLTERRADDPRPRDVGIWYADLKQEFSGLVVSLEQLSVNKPDERFKEAEHWVNHLQFSPSGKNVVFLHRWRRPQDKSWNTRMYVMRPNGTNLRFVLDTGLISHFDWRDDETLLVWAKLKRDEPKMAFLLVDVNGKPPEPVFESEKVDGHCSYSPGRKWVLNDTYPDKDRNQHLMLLNVKTGRRISLNKFPSPRQFTGPFRCDLHPRWNRDGTQICFDGCHDPQRQVYIVDVKDLVSG